MRLKIIYILLTFIAFVISCKTSFKVQTYQFQPYLDDIDDINEVIRKTTESDVKSIILKNDSVLVSWKRFGGLGIITTVKYYTIDNLLIIDSLDIYGNPCPEEIMNIRFIYSTDSLVNKKTNEKYYNQKYLDSIQKK
jgi:hypothetical protein